MPYENEHACRLRDPGDFKKGSFRRTTRKHEGKSYGVIMGKLKGEDAMTEQAYRYDKADWTASQARTHCKEHEGSFEAAQDSKSDRPEEMERRSMKLENAELRIEGDGNPRLVGYAAKYGVKADIGYFIEKIKAGAFDEVLKDSDARALKNHDANLLLGRESSGTLRLKSNSVGLHFEVDVPDTNTGRDIVEEVRRGDLNGCSFSFTVAEDEWKHAEGKPSERTIVKIAQLFDVGPVVYPAYQDTSVAVRSLNRSLEQSKTDEIDEQEIRDSEEEPKQIQTIDKDRRRQIEKGYRKAGRIIHRCRPSEDGAVT